MLVHAYPRVEEPAPKLKRSSNSPSVLPPPFSTASGALAVARRLGPAGLSGLKRKRD